jgi:hypothetical protein
MLRRGRGPPDALNGLVLMRSVNEVRWEPASENDTCVGMVKIRPETWPRWVRGVPTSQFAQQ